MKEDELRKHLICNLCHKKIGETGLPLFWIVKVERWGIKLDEVQRISSLQTFLGNAKLGSIMGTDPDVAVPMMEEIELTVCEDCCIKNVCIAQLAELK